MRVEMGVGARAPVCVTEETARERVHAYACTGVRVCARACVRTLVCVCACMCVCVTSSPGPGLRIYRHGKTYDPNWSLWRCPWEEACVCVCV